MVNVRVPIGYKFILGFIVVVASAVFVPKIIELFDVTEWLREPLSFLTAIVIGLVLGSFFTRSFTNHFTALTAMARRISLGDLSTTGELKFNHQFLRDESADLGEALVLMSSNLRGLVEHMKEAVTKLAEAQESFSAVVSKGHDTSKDVISGTSRIFEGALVQSNHIGEAASTVKEMAEMADGVASKVTEAANASTKVNSMVQRGATTSTSAIEKMEIIFKGIEDTANAAARLKEKLNDIPKILDVITHISRQTDLLALNATIEASKAGEHGRGFALVAEEVRRFADNTNRSVEEVSLIVKELKKEVENVVASAGEGASSLKHGRDDVRRVRDILVDITNYTTDVAERATVILGLTQKQKDKAGSAVDMIEKVARITRENLTTTEKVEQSVERHGAVINETIQASRKLFELSRELKAVAAKFNLA